MSFTYIRAFEHFDPQLGESPRLFNYQFNQIIGKARALLQNRSADEIKEKLRKIDRIITKSRLDSINAWIQDTGGVDMVVQDSPATYLTYHINHDDGSDPALMISNENAPEYFAVLALAFVGCAKSLEDLKHPYLGFTKETLETSNTELIMDFLADSEEAIEFSDSLKELEESNARATEKAIRKFQKEQQRRSRAAANARFSENARIKNEFISFRTSNDFKNTAEAARQYYESLSDTDKRIICPSLIPENAFRTLQTHYRRNMRANKKSPEDPS